MTAHPPTPFPRKGVIMVQPLRGFRIDDFAPPWGGPAEAH
jgi:hypothetical protein